MTTEKKQVWFRFFQKIPSQILILGWVSLFSDTSTEMVTSLIPIYLISHLGVTASQLGILEGTAQAVALMTKVFAGFLSDLFQSRKWLTVVGYGLAAISKPFFPLAKSYSVFFAARMMDRTGKGIRGAPRDALVADHTPANARGASFGFRQAMDNAGAFLGPVLAIVFMIVFHFSIKAILWISAIPIWMSVFLLITAIKDPPKSGSHAVKKFHISEIRHLSLGFWMLMIVVFAITLCQYGDTFLVLKAKELNVSLRWIPLVLIIMNFVSALSSYPLGSLSDRIGRDKLILGGMTCLALSSFILSRSNDIWTFGFGIGMWGLYLGATQGVFSAMVVDLVPASLRGTCIGIFFFVSGGALLVSNSFAGWMWEHHGSGSTFLVCTVGSVVATGLFLAIGHGGKHLKKTF